MLANHFSHHYSWRWQQRMPGLASVIDPSASNRCTMGRGIFRAQCLSAPWLCSVGIGVKQTWFSFNSRVLVYGEHSCYDNPSSLVFFCNTMVRYSTPHFFYFYFFKVLSHFNIYTLLIKTHKCILVPLGMSMTLNNNMVPLYHVPWVIVH